MAWKLTEQFAKEFAHEWIEAWNAHDLKRVLSHYSDDFEMQSPLIIQRKFDPSGILKGKEKIGEYWAVALKSYPDLHFTLTELLIGANSIVILYKNHRNITVAEEITFSTKDKHSLLKLIMAPRQIDQIEINNHTKSI